MAESNRVTKFVHESEFSVAVEEPDATDFVWSPDGRAVAVHATMLRKVTVFAVGSGQRLAQISNLAGGGRAVEFIADGRLVVPTQSGSSGGATVWNPSDGSVASLPAPLSNGDAITRLLFEFSVDARRSRLAGVHRKRLGAGMTFGIAVYDIPSRSLKGDYRIAARAAVISPDGELIAAVGARGRVDVVDFHSGRIVGSLDTGMSNVRVVAWNSDGSSLATGSMAAYASGAAGANGLLQLWDVRGRRRLAAIDENLGGGVESLDFSGNGAWLVTTAADGVCRLWDARTLAKMDTIAEGLHPTTALARFSPDSTRLAVLRTGAAKVSVFVSR